MTTRGGKLSKGDRLRHNPTGRIFEVVERTGNEASYGVYLRPVDGKPLGTRPSYKHSDAFLLTAAHHWIRQPNGPYELLKPGQYETMRDDPRPGQPTIYDLLRGEAAVEIAEWFVEAVDSGWRPKVLPEAAVIQAERLRKLLAEIDGGEVVLP